MKEPSTHFTVIIVIPEKDVEYIGREAAKIIEFMPLTNCYWIYHRETSWESV